MSDTMRWRYGDTNPVVLPVPADTVIEIGDLLYWDTDHVVPASEMPNPTAEFANLLAFHQGFAGVAMQRSRAGDTAPIRVATTGVFEFDMPSATAEVGAFVTASQPNDRLANQLVMVFDDASRAIGRCAKRVPAPNTRILVDIVSTRVHGGPQTSVS